MADVDDKEYEVRLALLERIAADVKRGATNMPSEVRVLAEAYAWLTAPNNSHGGK